MVKMRKAISMLELIISIVVMGIVILSIPLLLQQTSSSTSTSIVQQEAILEAKTLVWRVMSRHWDANSYDSVTHKAYIVNTTSQNVQLNISKRLGLTGYSGRRSKHPSNASAVPENTFVNAININNAQAIEDFHGMSIVLVNNSTNIDNTLRNAHSLDYVMKNIEGNITVRYMDDRFQEAGVSVDFNQQAINNLELNNVSFRTNHPEAQSSNIKIIKVILDTQQDIDADTINEKVILYAFACNIGESLPSIIRSYAP